MRIGPFEIAVLLTLALTFFGGGRLLPSIATGIGKAVKSARHLSR